MKRFVLGYVHTIDAFSEILGTIGTHLVLITVFIGFYNVVARYIGRFVGLTLSSNVLIELQWYLYSLVFFFGFAYILKHGINVRVDFIYANMRKKTKALIDFWGHLIFMVPFTLLGVYVTINPVLYSWGRLTNGTWGTWEMSPDPGGLPRAPIKSMIILAFVSLFLQFISELIKLFLVIIGKDEDIEVEELGDTEAPLRIE